MFGKNAMTEDMNSVVRHTPQVRQGHGAADCVIL